MYMITIDNTNCDGCGACVDPCPASLLELVDGKAEITGEPTECMGCETCVTICPNDCYSVKEL